MHEEEGAAKRSCDRGRTAAPKQDDQQERRQRVEDHVDHVVPGRLRPEELPFEYAGALDREGLAFYKLVGEID